MDLIGPMRGMIGESVRTGGLTMEVYYYVCPQCGYVHQVPAYWMGYAPEAETDMPHIHIRTGEVCENTTLTYREENE